MNNDQLQAQKAWYKTGGGIVFLGILGMLTLVALIFGGFVSYYIYEIGQGNGAEIAKQLQKDSAFSTVQGPDKGSISTGIDPSPFIRLHNPQFGNISSPVKIIAFIDFECPYCREAFPTFEHIREKYESGVHIIFKHFPLVSIHPLSTRAGLAASCAQDQDAFWPYYKHLFESRTLSRDALLEGATAIGLNEQIFSTCLDTEKNKLHLSQDITDGLELGVRGTPTYFIGSKKLEGVVPLDVWDNEIIRALQSE